MRIFIIFLFLVNFNLVFGQKFEDINTLIVNNQEHKHSWEIAKNNNSTMQIVYSSLFLFYKNFISSQDSQKCSFTPSCSSYSVESIKKQGLLVGMLDTFDRLMRCNGLSSEKYEVDNEQNLLIDPVRNVKFQIVK